MHRITNIDGKNKIFAICNCNVNVCYALRTSQLFNTPNMSRSAYIAKVDKSSCVACGKCVESCPAGAVKLGQKLCDKEGCEIEISEASASRRYALASTVTHNYRDVNRIVARHGHGSMQDCMSCPYRSTGLPAAGRRGALR